MPPRSKEKITNPETLREAKRRFTTTDVSMKNLSRALDKIRKETDLELAINEETLKDIPEIKYLNMDYFAITLAVTRNNVFDLKNTNKIIEMVIGKELADDKYIKAIATIIRYYRFMKMMDLSVS